MSEIDTTEGEWFDGELVESADEVPDAQPLQLPQALVARPRI
jgi:hypothetical protein